MWRRGFIILLLSFPLWADGIIDQQLPDFYQQLKQKQTFSDAWESGKFHTVQQWRQHGRKLLRDSLLWPDEPVDFSPRLIRTEAQDGYKAEIWSVQLTLQSRVNLMLLTPDLPKPLPAVLLLHDHGARFDIGKEKWIKPFKNDQKLASAQQWADKYFSGNFVGDELARQGYVVLAADTFGWSERGPIAYDAQQAMASNLYLLGRSLAGMAAYEDLRQVEFLKQLPQVDKNRLAVIGFSMGAFKAWQLAALSDDIKATVSVAWMNSYQYLMQPGNNLLKGQSSFYMLHPGLSAKLDIPDVASLAAPSAMLLINGARDTLMPREGVEYAYARMAKVWQAYGASEKFSGKIWPQYGHEFSAEQQQQAFNWLAAQLAK